MINIINKHHKLSLPSSITIYCGRGSILGNPFTHLESNFPGSVRVRTRNEACDMYEDYFQSQLLNPQFSAELARISSLSQFNNINLECFCAPARCHCETIKHYLETTNEQSI